MYPISYTYIHLCGRYGFHNDSALIVYGSYCKTFPGEVPCDYNVVYITQTMQPLLIRLRTSVTFLAAQTRREQREGLSMITVVWTMPRRMPPTEMVMN